MDCTDLGIKWLNAMPSTHLARTETMKETILKANNIVFGITAFLTILGGGLIGWNFGHFAFQGLASYGVVVASPGQSFFGCFIGLLLSTLFVALVSWPFVILSCMHDRLKQIELNTQMSRPSRHQDRAEPSF
ncbi:hypothetical protein TU87_22690 [Pseudomonas weihenstephanensis]|mgnify:CR=1 FL=1|nr:hypothetical protein TU87_22690 [Pseudomonas weihenstephanensis]